MDTSCDCSQAGAMHEAELELMNSAGLISHCSRSMLLVKKAHLSPPSTNPVPLMVTIVPPLVGPADGSGAFVEGNVQEGVVSVRGACCWCKTTNYGARNHANVARP